MIFKDAVKSKTNITAFVSIIGTIAGIYTGTLPMIEGIKIIIGALIGIFLRLGIDKQGDKVAKAVIIANAVTEGAKAELDKPVRAGP